ncbi:MAG: SDR family oxidoreductase [Chloroflexi bacterium]|nr:SDR family oxidoreductase [Chloroflexota bacterium]
MADGCVVVVGGTSGLGLEIARHYASAGRRVVISGRDAARAADIAATLPGEVTGIGLDLADPHGIAGALASIGPVGSLVLAAIDRDENTIRDYAIDRAIRLATIKLVGYSEVVHCLTDRFTPDAAIVVFGGLAKDRPYPGSTTVSTVNGGVLGMVRTLCHELAPVRVNSLHPGIVGDSPYWSGKTDALDRVQGRTLTKRLVAMEDIVGATRFLLENRSVNGVDLWIDGGWIIN